MNPTATADALPLARIRLWPLAVTAALLTWAADFLFWDSVPGVSLGVFGVLLAVGILLHRPGRWNRPGVWVAFLLLLGACVECAVEICLTNVCVLVALLLILGGGTWFTGVPAGWRRWLRQGVALLACVERPFWLFTTWLSQRGPWPSLSPPLRVARLVTILAPGALLIVVFTALLASGNVVFQNYLQRFGTVTWNWLLRLEWTPGRMTFWFGAAAVVLGFLRPLGASATGERRELGRWERRDPNMARGQSIVALVAVNLLFAIVNTIDAVDLWLREALPPTLDRKAFLHAGVNSLIAATVLAAMVLAVLFQQSRAVAGSRWLRGLGQLWIVQNLALAASVFRRDWLYVFDSHLLTEKRVYVLCFLGLVVVGYAFLAVHVQRGGGLGRLIWRNAVATFALFYVMQFLNVGGWVSQWCARRSLADSQWGFDVTYWSSQGPDAWPALLAVAKAPEGHPQKAAARSYLAGVRGGVAASGPADWRSWQGREAANRAALLAEFPAATEGPR